MDGFYRHLSMHGGHPYPTRKKHAYRCRNCGKFIESGRKIHRKFHECKECTLLLHPTKGDST